MAEKQDWISDRQELPSGQPCPVCGHEVKRDQRAVLRMAENQWYHDACLYPNPDPWLVQALRRWK